MKWMEAGLSVAIIAISGEAFAAMSHEKEQTARGLAQIIDYADSVATRSINRERYEQPTFPFVIEAAR